MGGGLLLELEFPNPIIQRIQSLLTRKEAARTTILSKSWHGAWMTHPNLDLDVSDFKARHSNDDHYAITLFSKYAKKTIKRCYPSHFATKQQHSSCYSLPDSSSYSLSHELVFGAENLVELSVEGCKIINVDGIVIKCCRLESLCLDGMDTDTVSKIILSCPLIEKLSLSNIVYHRECYGGGWEVEQDPDLDIWSDVQVRAPAPRSGPIIIDNLYRLKCLVLCYESFKTLFPGDSLTKFPFLTDLTLHLKQCYLGGRDVQISNCSLERIKIELGNVWYDCARERMLKVRLDVPSIRKFTFEGDAIPKLSFMSTPSSSWESHVSLTSNAGFTACWFHELNKFLTQLRQSKIHLSLRVQSTESFDYKVGDVNIVSKHELENLTVDMTGLPSFSCYALFDGLFRLCRPKLITQQNPCKDRGGYRDPHHDTSKTNIDFLCQVLEQGMLQKVSFQNQLMYGLNDLEEVNAQIFDIVDDVPGWRPIPLNSLLDEEHRHRFLLEWKPLLA